MATFPVTTRQFLKLNKNAHPLHSIQKKSIEKLTRFAIYRTRHLQGDALIDHRIDMLDPTLFNGKYILDIGCTSGNIAIALARKYKLAYIKGVDIDETLIKKAINNLRATYSLRKPGETVPESFDLSLRSHYFPQSMTNMFGMIPMAVPPNFPKTEFPWTVDFEAVDWAKDVYDENEPKYDTLMALSVTKWIQLHHGDKGLKSFFKKCYDALREGGTLVLEPIEIKFKKMAKKLHVEKVDYHFLPEHYHDFLIHQLGFREMQDLGCPKGSKTPILLFIK
ncbi:Bicoid-interacting protein 3-domain-containing protein [Mucor mucedo]|uniref:Bicoid-interacting protein 3-domain-containing protein n=1 Tax=Mucor mucedo TaxID=29922 RepID=UPI0022204634|nr:Bicoid-interacting protein 3-domain-containing protein [Mucor mucedo]KAI7889258.1 Bicoid-interacting protein 3-domain-containing protein [Mucor mucedo]